MNNTTITASSIDPAWELTGQVDAGSYYLSRIPADNIPVAIDHEESLTCAGIPFSRSMMVVDRLDSSLAAGVELISPISIEAAEPKGDLSSIEITLGHDAGGQLVTVESGFTFDGSDADTVPGVEVDYTEDGQVVALRVDRARINTDAQQP